MEILGYSITKLSLIIGASLFAIVLYFIGKKQAKNRIIKELNEELKKHINSGNRDSVDIILRKLREKR